MNKVFEVAGKVVLGVCLYGIYRKTYDWGKEYIADDIRSMYNAGKQIKDSIKNRREA